MQNKGVRTEVSERFWLFSLAYSVVTQLLPFLSLWLFLPYLGRIVDFRGKRDSFPSALAAKTGIVVGSVFGLFWTYLVLRDATASLQAWRSLR